MPQSAAGKTVMTTEPKFIPDEAVEINRKFTERVPCEGEIRVRCDDVSAKEAAQCVIDAISIAKKPLQA